MTARAEIKNERKSWCHLVGVSWTSSSWVTTTHEPLEARGVISLRECNRCCNSRYVRRRGGRGGGGGSTTAVRLFFHGLGDSMPPLQKITPLAAAAAAQIIDYFIRVSTRKERAFETTTSCHLLFLFYSIVPLLIVYFLLRLRSLMKFFSKNRD